MNLLVALEGLYPYCPGVYCVWWAATGAGFEVEQPMTSVTRRPPKGVRCERMK